MLLFLVLGLSSMIGCHVVRSAPTVNINVEAGETDNGVVNWQEYYLRKYEQELTGSDEDSDRSLFATGDDLALKDYYDYIDHLDEEERTEILNMLHEEEEEEEEDADENAADDVMDENFTDDNFTDENFTDENFTDENITDENFTDEILTDGTTESIKKGSTGTSKNAPQITQPAFQPIPLSGQFDHYDVIGHDKVITLEELARVTGALENIRQAFQESDTNGKCGNGIYVEVRDLGFHSRNRSCIEAMGKL
jgi:hypothetical protein